MKIIENSSVKFYIENGIMYSEFKDKLKLNLETGKEMIDLRHKISDNKKQYWCYDFKNIQSISKEARDYAEKHGQEYLHATAFIINSHLAKFVLNAFMKLKKADIPLKTFKTKEDAVNWLLTIKKSNEEKGIY